MWLSRKNSFSSPPTPRSPSSNSNFNRRSFKNIEDLLGDDDKDVSTTNGFSDLNSDQPQPQKQKQKHPSPNYPTSVTARKHSSVFHRVRLANQFTHSFSATKSKHVHEKSRSESHDASPSPTQKSETYASGIRIAGAEKWIVVYLTSLRVVRPTFEACRNVRSILTGFSVMVDERDLSMDSSFKDELQKIMAQGGEVIQKNNADLSKVFIGGRYIGDAEDLRHLNETGELKKMVEGLPAVSRGVCEGYSDYKFTIYKDGNGSRKCYKEKVALGVVRRAIRMVWSGAQLVGPLNYDHIFVINY